MNTIPMDPATAIFMWVLSPLMAFAGLVSFWLAFKCAASAVKRWNYENVTWLPFAFLCSITGVIFCYPLLSLLINGAVWIK